MPARRQDRIRILAGAAMAVLFAAGGRPVLGEQPTWSEVHSPLYSVVYHQYRGPDPEINARQGIWRWSIDHNTWNRLAPFFYWCTGYTSYPGFGNGSYLTAIDDRLLFEVSMWSWIEIDPAAGRFIRRYQAPDFSPAVTTGTSLGEVHAAELGVLWGQQGPSVSRDDGAPFGLAEGTYAGFTGNPHTLILFAPRDGTRFRLFGDFNGQPEDAGNWEHALSFDRRRGGFWITGQFQAPYDRIDVSFFPITAGALNPANAVRSRVPFPSGYDYARFSFYDPHLDALLVQVMEHEKGDQAIVKLDPTTWQTTVLATTGDPRFSDPVPWTLARLPADPPTTYEQTIPILVRAPGRNQTYWSSDLWLYNPSATATTVTLRRIVKPTVTKTVDLPARGSFKAPNALEWIGGGPAGDGVTHDAIVITSPYRWGEQVVAVSRIWTPSLDAGEAGRGGTMGEGVPAVPGTTGYSNHVKENQLDMYTGMNAMLVLDHREAGRFRHNLGLANDRDEAVTVNLSWGAPIWYDAGWVPDGWPRAGEKQDVTVAAHGVTIVSLEELFPAAVQSGLQSQIRVTGLRPIALWLSMVDNHTGDGIHVPYSLWWMLGDADSRVATPAVAHLPGAKGTRWLSDLYVTAYEMEGEGWMDQPIGRFSPAWTERCGGVGSVDGLAGRLIGVNPSPADPAFSLGVHSIVPDVVRQFPACSQEDNVRGALELQASSWMGGYVRTYTTRADGGTYGEMMPFYPPNGWPVQHFAGIEMTPEFRVNLGLFNGNHDHAITHRLILYAADGTKVAEREIVLQPRASMQDRVEKMFDKPLDSFPAGTYGLTVVPLDDQANGVEGRSWAFVSMVDNVTGDPTNWW